MKWRGLFLTVVFASVIAACGEPAGAPKPVQSGGSADAGGTLAAMGIEGSWELVDGAPIVDGFPITLNVESDTFTGTAACNGYGGKASTVNGTWVTSGVGHTEMACEPAVMESESAYLKVLMGVTSWSIADGMLEMRGETGTLTFAPGRPVDKAPVDGNDQVQAAESPVVELASVCGFIELGESQDPVLPDAPLSKAAQEALEPYLERTDGEYGFFSQYVWFVHNDGPTEILLFGVPLKADAEGYADARFELIEGTWQPTGWGGCHPTVAPFGESPEWGLATWILDPNSPPDGVSSEISVLIMEKSCASGQPPVDRAIRAQTRQDGDGLIITVLVEPVEGDASCPSNPWYRTVIDLGESPGERRLLDGSETPAEERRWPPEHPDYFGDES